MTCQAALATDGVVDCHRKAKVYRGSRNLALCLPCDKTLGGRVGQPRGCDRCETCRATRLAKVPEWNVSLEGDVVAYCDDCFETMVEGRNAGYTEVTA